MALFEQLKNIPKVDLHINMTSSISTNLAFDLTQENSIIDVEEKMRERNSFDYLDSLKLPIKILKSQKNIELATNDLIDRLISNNVIYGELFLDINLYNNKIDLEKTINIILKVIENRKYHLELVLCISSKNSRDENLSILEIFEKYYHKGVNGIYFYKEKMDYLNDYRYLFDRMIKNKYPYIINLNSMITNQDYDIYMNAKRLIYSLNFIDEKILNDCKLNNIMLEFSLTRLKENNIITNYKDYFIYDLINSNYLLALVSSDMTTLNTDILNEICILFNNYPVNIHDLIKVIINNITNIDIDDLKKNELMNEFKEKSNLVL